MLSRDIYAYFLIKLFSLPYCASILTAFAESKAWGVC
jgi:hypothetical protein